jgi:hypothetical protein
MTEPNRPVDDKISQLEAVPLRQCCSRASIDIQPLGSTFDLP